MMNHEQFKSLVAKFIAVIGGFLLGTGWASPFIIENWEAISGLLMSLATLAYSLYVNTPTQIVAAASAVVTGEGVTVTPAVARAVDKVAENIVVEPKKRKKSQKGE